MAGYRLRNGSFQVFFSHAGRQHFFTLGAVSEEEARAKAGQADLLLMRLKQRLAILPPGMGIVEYIQFDGRTLAPESPEVRRQTLGTLRDRFVEVHQGSIEPNTLNCIHIHFRHFVRQWGERFDVTALGLADLQSYVNGRAKTKGRHGRTISTVTIQKELATLKAAWRWGCRMKMLNGAFPATGLRYPKANEKPPFMTIAEIERRISGGGLSDSEQNELWEALYLTKDQIAALLDFVKETASQPFLYPALSFVAHTGARRSEMLRVKPADIDFTNRMITIREKKRTKGQNTTRRVPMTPFLEAVLKVWMESRPQGRTLFCQRSGLPMPPAKATDHLRRCLDKGKWKVVKGYHVCRHAFISACAMKGLDQRFIDEWVGHQTEQQRRRYRHLTPSSQRAALARVFG